MLHLREVGQGPGGREPEVHPGGAGAQPSLLTALPPPGEGRALSDCGPGSPCHPGRWRSTSSGRPSGGCSKVWMGPGPVSTHPRCAGTPSAVSTGWALSAGPSPAPSLPSSSLVPPGRALEAASLSRSPAPLQEPCSCSCPFLSPPPGLHSRLPASAPPALQHPTRCLAPLAPVAASAPAPGASPEAPTPAAPASPAASCSPSCPRPPAPVGRLRPPLLPAGGGPGGPGPGPPCLLGPPAGLALGPALRAAFCGPRGSEPSGAGPACHCHPCPCRDPRPRRCPQAGPCLHPLLPTQAPAAGGQPWLH